MDKLIEFCVAVAGSSRHVKPEDMELGAVLVNVQTHWPGPARPLDETSRNHGTLRTLPVTICPATAGIAHRFEGEWHGEELQHGLGLLDVQLTLKLPPPPKSELTGASEIPLVADATPVLSGTCTVTTKDKTNAFAPYDSFHVEGYCRGDDHICLTYKPMENTRRFGFILLEMDDQGETLFGFFLGHSAILTAAEGLIDKWRNWLTSVGLNLSTFHVGCAPIYFRRKIEVRP